MQQRRAAPITDLIMTTLAMFRQMAPRLRFCVLPAVLVILQAAFLVLALLCVAQAAHAG
jgi:hypothetical protein